MSAIISSKVLAGEILFLACSTRMRVLMALVWGLVSLLTWSIIDIFIRDPRDRAETEEEDNVNYKVISIFHKLRRYIWFSM